MVLHITSPPKKGEIGIYKFNSFQCCMQNIVNNRKHVIVMGDFYLPNIDFCTPTVSDNL